MTTSTADFRAGNPFAPSEYIVTDTATGVRRNRFGRRIVALTEDFIKGFREALDLECGEAADEVMRTCGRTFGKTFAERFCSELASHFGTPAAEFPLALFETCLARAMATYGWGVMKLDYKHHQNGLVLVEFENAIFYGIVGESDRPVETLLNGVLGGFFSHLAKQDLTCVQSACQSCGATKSRFIVTLSQRVESVQNLIDESASHDELVAALLETRVAA